MKINSTQKKPPKISIQEKVTFVFAHQQNAHNVSLALCAAGYYVNMCNTSGGYMVRVFTDRNL